LVEAQSAYHLWADHYDRDLPDVFAVQDEIAQSITGAIAPGIVSAEIRHAQQKARNQLDAWDRMPFARVFERGGAGSALRSRA
jgi:adenylate cyclase